MNIKYLKDRKREQVKSELKAANFGKTMQHGDSRTKKALTTGTLHYPIYCTLASVPTSRYQPLGKMDELVGGLIQTTYSYHQPKFSIMHVLDLLMQEAYEPNFYGLIVSTGDEFIGMSHPYTLQHFIDMVNESLIEGDVAIFDTIIVSKFDNIPVLNREELKHIAVRESELYSLVMGSNVYEYKFESKLLNEGEGVRIKETYNDVTTFNVTLPVHTCRYEHSFFPYYGINTVSISTRNPLGMCVWPIHSPNIDVFNTGEVCTGQNVKVVPALSSNQSANFNSGFNSSLHHGTLNVGYSEAIYTLLCRTREILQGVLGHEYDIEYSNPITDLLEEVEASKSAVDRLQGLIKEITGGLMFSSNAWQNATSLDGVKRLLGEDGTGVDVLILVLCSALLNDDILQYSKSTSFNIDKVKASITYIRLTRLESPTINQKKFLALVESFIENKIKEIK